MQSRLRPDLPEMPDRIRRLPVDPVRQIPVPWFVAWIDGKPEFRVADADKKRLAIKCRLCWVCGEVLGVHKAFVLGPMCAVNRVSAEPPCHLECAEFSVRACPFLSRPQMERREGGLPEEAGCAGHMITRNPGVTLVWVTRTHELVGDGRGGVLFQVGPPESVTAWSQGRPATLEEVRESVDTGLPLLAKLAQAQGGEALKALAACALEARQLLGIA